MNWLPTIIIFAPLLGLFILLFTPKKKQNLIRVIGIVATLPSLALLLYLFQHFDLGQKDWQWVQNIPWFQFTFAGERGWAFFYHLGVDGISMPLLFMTALISTLTAIASVKIQSRIREYYMLLLLMETSMLGVFFSLNLFLFFIFFEVILVAMYFLIGIWGQIQKERAANLFLLYNGLGSGFLLFAMVLLLMMCNTLEFPDISKMIPLAAKAEPTFTWVIFWSLLIAFAIKLPIFPFHTWMLRVHVQAAPSVVMIHAGILLKIGAYGLLRFHVGWFPEQMKQVSILLITFGLINLFYGAILAFVQKELRQVLAYSSISHMGILLVGIASMQLIGLQGALFQAISHGFIAALFFFLVAILYERTNTTELNELGGLTKSMPYFAGFLLFTGLASLGLPGLSGFISEFLSFLGLFRQHVILGSIASLGLIFAAVYILRAMMKINYGPTPKRFDQLSDLRWTESLPIAVFVAVIIGIGIAPDLIGKSMQMTLQMMLERIGG
nr:NADH-quinone oxidoreductase subunit M [Seinonella peptonophila]